MGARIQNVVRELGAERVDIIEWKEDPVAFISSALSPAKVSSIKINKEEKSAHVYVPEKDLSLAIGKEGQNVRLAVKLTGWKIDILSEKEAALEEKADETKNKNAEDTTEKIKVHELAKQMSITSKELLAKLAALGCEAKAANSIVPPAIIAKLKKQAG
jgi:transcription antitermination factor NusA-like protein